MILNTSVMSKFAFSWQLYFVESFVLIHEIVVDVRLTFLERNVPALLAFSWFGVTAMLFCWNNFMVQIGPKLLCVNDGIAGCLALQKTQPVEH